MWLYLVKNNKLLNSIFPEPPVIAYRNNPSQNKLVRAKLKPIGESTQSSDSHPDQQLNMIRLHNNHSLNTHTPYRTDALLGACAYISTGRECALISELRLITSSADGRGQVLCAYINNWRLTVSVCDRIIVCAYVRYAPNNA